MPALQPSVYEILSDQDDASQWISEADRDMIFVDTRRPRQEPWHGQLGMVAIGLVLVLLCILIVAWDWFDPWISWVEL